MWRILLIALLGTMASINFLLDFLMDVTISGIRTNVIILVLAAGFATALPPGLAFLISSKARFKILGVSIYRVASDLILGLGLVTWFYLLFIRERPEYYEGASHLYVAIWPTLLGVVAVGLYLICLLVQATSWTVKHNKSKHADL